MDNWISSCIRFSKNILKWDIRQVCLILRAPMTKSIHTREQKCLQLLLRKMRAEAGLTQDVLAQRLHLPQSFVSKYESGERMLDVMELRRVCTTLGIRFPDFATRLEKELSDAT
jgi:DNA-binding XRE family transcriptional regulator